MGHEMRAEAMRFCNCTNEELGAIVECDMGALGAEALHAKIGLHLCTEPATLNLDVEVPAAHFHREIHGIEEGEHDFVLQNATVHIPHVGEATPVAKVVIEGNAGHVEASVSLDACGIVFDKQRCASELPGGLFPMKLVDIDRD